MNKTQLIQRFCFVMRMLTIATAIVFVGYLIFGSFIIEDWDMNFGEEPFQKLWHGEHVAKGWLLLVAAPELLMTLMFYFWLQALFGRYHQGEFFTDASMRCYLWLVWLSMAIFIYEIFAPLLLLTLPVIGIEDLGVEMRINVGEFFTLTLLIVIIYVLRTAQSIDAENKEFV